MRVQLLRVRGGSCIEGQTWYHDDRAIRVRNGCRATFRIDANNGWGVGGWDPNQGVGNGIGGGRWQVVRCESWNYRNQRCPVQGVISAARMLRVIAAIAAMATPGAGTAAPSPCATVAGPISK